MSEGPAVARALAPFGTSIFTEMSALAARCGAVNLSQGFPDFDGPSEIRAAAAAAIVRGPNQYAPSPGLLELREAVAAKMGRFYGVAVSAADEVTVTAGATEALAAAFLGLLDPGDEVVLIEPCYDLYAPMAARAGAIARYVSLVRPGFVLPREELAAAFGPRTKLVVINNPQNPCGKVWSRDDLAFVASLCEEHDAYVMGDEVYEHLTYGGRRHETLLAIPGLRDRAIVVSSTAKTFSMTGWKVGWTVAAPRLTQAVRMSHQFLTFCTPPAFQEAMAAAIASPDSYYEGFLRAYDARREKLCSALARLGLFVIHPEGTYYALVDVSGLGLGDDMEFCRFLTSQVGVAAIPCSAFWDGRRGGRELARFCFCKRDETLDLAIERLERWRR
jgi:N-succinyldiaminopimelate aminotransferase